jgi:dephospho-CoA kinase
MPEPRKAKIIAIVGMPGAGKSETVNFLTKKDWPKIYFGGIVYDEMKKQGIEITPQSQQDFREDWREREGKDVIVKKAIEQIHNLIEAGQRQIVLDGVYSWTEYKALKHEFPGEIEVIAIIAPRRVRHHRLSIRPERPFTEEEATIRDWAQIENLEQGGPIAAADRYIINDGTLEDLSNKIDTVLAGDFAE